MDGKLFYGIVIVGIIIFLIINTFFILKILKPTQTNIPIIDTFQQNNISNTPPPSLNKNFCGDNYCSTDESNPLDKFCEKDCLKPILGSISTTSN